MSVGDDEALVDAVAQEIKAEINKFVAPAYSYIESEAASRIEKRTGEYPWDEDAGQLVRESYAIIARVAIAAINASGTHRVIKTVETNVPIVPADDPRRIPPSRA